MTRMLATRTSIVIIVVVLFAFFSHSEAWRRRRRRRCTPRDCEVSSWSSWNQCTANQCGQRGSQSRSRTEISSTSCGGAQCPELYETRQCYSAKPSDCVVGPWSEWSACTTPCGVSGIRTSLRHRTTVEQCGGTCTSTFSKTRSCPEISCLNGGSVKDGTCFCKEGYGGDCCEKGGENKGVLAGILTPCLIVALVGAVVFYVLHKKGKCWVMERDPEVEECSSVHKCKTTIEWPHANVATITKEMQFAESTVKRKRSSLRWLFYL